MKSKRPPRSLAALLLATAVACDDDGPTSPRGRSFQVRVGSETFRMRVTDADAIRLAMENMTGGNSKHPEGRIAVSDGGHNAPWSWHFVPETVRMVDASMELCDGEPSYVEAHRADHLASGYCPWGARIISAE
jgi:hypothetical protein